MHYQYQTKDNVIEITRKNSLDFQPHLHYHIELSYVAKGTCYAYADGSSYTLKSGDIFITFPNQVHYFANSHDMDAYVLLLSPQAFPEYEHILSCSVPASPFVKHANNEYIHKLIVEAYHAEGIFHDAIVRSYCSILLGTIFNTLICKNISSLEANTTNKLINYCNLNYTENISLKSISENLHISTSRISHIFGDILKTNFREFINMLRLNKAEQLLINSNLNIIDIAIIVGFENVRTFNRCFLSRYGCTPTAFRKKNR